MVQYMLYNITLQRFLPMGMLKLMLQFPLSLHMYSRRRVTERLQTKHFFIKHL